MSSAWAVIAQQFLLKIVRRSRTERKPSLLAAGPGLSEKPQGLFSEALTATGEIDRKAIYKRTHREKTELKELIEGHVDLAIAHQFRLELAHPVTGQSMTIEERRAFLTCAFIEIAKGMDIDRFMQTPATIA